MLSVLCSEFHQLAVFAECHYIECRYAECRGALPDWAGLSPKKFKLTERGMHLYKPMGAKHFLSVEHFFTAKFTLSVRTAGFEP